MNSLHISFRLLETSVASSDVHKNIPRYHGKCFVLNTVGRDKVVKLVVLASVQGWVWLQWQLITNFWFMSLLFQICS